MYVSETWLRELVDPPLTTQELSHQLTMAGLEIGGVEMAAPEFSGVVIGKVLKAAKHPNAEKLSVCEVDVGDKMSVNIVCGAPNVRTGLTVAVAKIGAKLPGDFKIKRAKLRGEVSEGMICSARELGLGDEHDGILELPESLPVGADFRDQLALNDQILEVELTPNRGDCLGMYGVAREVAVLNEVNFEAPKAPSCKTVIEDQIAVYLDAPEACARYVGRVVRNINAKVNTPLWMTERLRRGGIRAIHPVVDITNYVMLESGKPMHGFDLSTMNGDVHVRYAQKNEALTLLDGKELKLNPHSLVIADESGARALAGIMGGIDTGVSSDTTDVFFESAYFDPLHIAGKARSYGLHTDASHRFERGVDPALCVDSVERATQLLLEICGGEPGPTVVAENSAHLPRKRVVELKQEHLERLIGRTYDKSSVSQILRRLGMTTTETTDGWAAEIPGYRFDLAIAEDLIEEIVRVDGYDQVLETPGLVEHSMDAMPETTISLSRIQDVLISRGYQEAITYSFIDPELHRTLCPDSPPIILKNPISADMAVMRSSMLPGLLTALKKNLSRQKSRVRLFETGLSFIQQDNDIKQEDYIGIIATGALNPEQWGIPNRDIGFFEFKSDIEALLALGGQRSIVDFSAEHNPALHPAQSARIRIDGNPIGWIGALHPKVAAELEIEKPTLFCELLLEQVCMAKVPSFRPISKFPEIRRDLAFVIKEEVSVAQILKAVRAAAPDCLKDLRVFDIYRGDGIEAGAKSIALGLILQEYSRTLTDVDADEAIALISASLKQNLQAKIRD